jgi:hypothetical protein
MDRQRTRRLSSTFLRIGLSGSPFLIAGLATTVALALGLAALGSAATRTDSAFRDRSRFNGEGLGRLVVHRSIRPGVIRLDATVHPTCVSAASTGGHAPEDLVPAWARGPALPWSTGERPWPASQDSGAAGAATESASIEGAGWPMTAIWHGHQSPLWRPVWPGLIANTALFAGAWWWLFLLPRFSLALSRSWRGCCGCGYDLAGLAPVSPGRVRCPECGDLCRAPSPKVPALRAAA